MAFSLFLNLDVVRSLPAVEYEAPARAHLPPLPAAHTCLAAPRPTSCRLPPYRVMSQFVFSSVFSIYLVQITSLLPTTEPLITLWFHFLLVYLLFDLFWEVLWSFLCGSVSVRVYFPCVLWFFFNLYDFCLVGYAGFSSLIFVWALQVLFCGYSYVFIVLGVWFVQVVRVCLGFVCFASVSVYACMLWYLQYTFFLIYSFIVFVWTSL